MVHANAVDFDEMRGRLLTLDDIQGRLAASEPLSEVTFTTGSGVKADFGSAPGGGPWHMPKKTKFTGDAAPVWLTIPDGEGQYQLTDQAASQLASECHITEGYQALVEADPVLAFNVNWWLQSGLGEHELKLLSAGSGIGMDGQEVPLVQAVCRHTVSPFSNLRLLQVMLEGIGKKYGEGEVLGDYKFHHDLERTHLRLIVPGYQRSIQGTSVHDDTWSLGLDFYNSLTGDRQLELGGYLFRWWCTNGCYDIANQSGGFARRNTTEEDAVEWARESVDEILGHLEPTFDQVQALTSQPVAGDVVTVLKGLFREYGVPRRERTRIIETMADTPDLSMYELMSAVTMAANIEGLHDRDVHRLLNLGGHIAHASTGLCSNCHQLLPEGWEAPAEGDEGEAIATLSAL